MKRTSGRCVTGLVGLLAGGLAALAPATAAPLEHEHFQEDVRTVIRNFCGDLRVLEHRVIKGMDLINARGPDGLAYFLGRARGRISYTNLANGKTFTEVFSTISKDLRVTNNGDGTLTILVLATGGYKVYGPDGKLLFRDPGQIRFELLVDHGGTPRDPSDDEFLEFLGLVKGSTGRNDTEGRDFCEDIHTFIG
jgi:hypothetical protein